MGILVDACRRWKDTTFTRSVDASRARRTAAGCVRPNLV